MTAMIIPSGPLSASLKSDPIMNYLLNGGSWFEADQMYWRQVLGSTETALARGPSASRRKALLQTKVEALKQLGISVPAAISTAVKGGQTLPTATTGAKNVFSALAESSEEE